MSKITITLEDQEDGTVTCRTMTDQEFITETPATLMAYSLMHFFSHLRDAEVAERMNEMPMPKESQAGCH